MKNVIKNVSFGNQFATFKNVRDLTTSSKEVQIAAFGRTFPLRATKDQMISRIDEFEAAMKEWAVSLEVLRKQVILEDYVANKVVYQQFLSPEQFAALKGIEGKLGDGIEDAQQEK